MSHSRVLPVGLWPLSARVRIDWRRALPLRHRAGQVRIGVVRDRAGFNVLEHEWNDLFRRAGKDTQLFQTFNWNWHWANHYLPAESNGAAPVHATSRRSLAIVTVRRGGQLIALWPLVISRCGGLRVVQWMGDPVSQYGDVLIDDVPDRSEVLRRCLDFITTQLGADVLHLRKVRADAAIAPVLRETGVPQVTAAAAPYLDLASAPDFTAYEKRYSSKERKNRRRLYRRLQERGPLSIKRLTGTPAAGEGARAAITLKRTTLKSAGRIAPAASNDRFAAFFADAAQSRTRPAGCHVTILESNEQPAGYAVDITCGRHRAAHIIVHDPALNPYSAGMLLLQEWIRGACADGIATFDLLAPAYAYKFDWADASVPVHDFALGLTLRGEVFARVYLGLIRERLKAAIERSAIAMARLRGPPIRRDIPLPLAGRG